VAEDQPFLAERVAHPGEPAGAEPGTIRTDDATREASEAAIVFENVSFTYPSGSRPAVDGLSFELLEGELDLRPGGS
jgi:ABC-type transport system involved in cytochrome bd biosynthesis fused ATPase/permease subunit